MINVYVGVDGNQDFPPKFNDIKNPCYEVCKKSILNHSDDINVIPLRLDELREDGLYYRDVDPMAATEFTYSRFLVPYLNDYEGIAIFCDSDFLWNCDINELLKYFYYNRSVLCVQHDYVTKLDTKMDGLVNTNYRRKNWASLMMFNCGHEDTKKLTIESVNTKDFSYLHGMDWTDNVGSIPLTYNWLEGDYEYKDNPKAIHFTNGGPWHETWSGDYSEEWIKVYDEIVR
tara:strand:- start:64 stop:753 length:690 start_codon:yes stop_codon:yes gene_type:complete